MTEELGAFLLSAMSVVWLVIVVLLIILEATTVNLISIWFAVGAVAALMASVRGWSFFSQLVVFAVVSAAALAATRPLVRKFTSRAAPHTNADRVLDAVGRVTETVDDERGAVYVDGKTWTARSATGEAFPAGSRVRIERIEGVRVYVTGERAAETAPLTPRP